MLLVCHTEWSMTSPLKYRLLGLIFFVATITFAYLFLFTDRIPKKFAVYNDYANLSSYPVVLWGDVTNGSLAKYLMRLYEEGRITGFGDNVLPMTVYRQVNPLIYEKRGYGYMELFESQVKEGRYYYGWSRPYRFVAFYKTKIGGADYYLLMQLWQNADKTVRVVPYVVSAEKYAVGGQVNPVYQAMMGGEAGRYPAPVVVIRDKAACEEVYGTGTEYFRWYMRNKPRYDTAWGRIVRLGPPVITVNAWGTEEEMVAEVGYMSACTQQLPYRHNTHQHRNLDSVHEYA